MSDRRVTKTRKNADGDITALCNPSENWSPRYKWDAIQDIEDRVHSYHVTIDSKRVGIVVVKGQSGKYLRTDPDKTPTNNLDYLPDC